MQGTERSKSNTKPCLMCPYASSYLSASVKWLYDVLLAVEGPVAADHDPASSPAVLFQQPQIFQHHLTSNSRYPKARYPRPFVLLSLYSASRRESFPTICTLKHY